MNNFAKNNQQADDSGTLPKDSTEFSYEFSAPLIKANIKSSAEDFRVNEKLKFELSGEGQHLCLLIEKKFLNTQDALMILSRFFKVPPKDIGYFGLKDKMAVTQQWFSVDLAASKLDKTSFDVSDVDNFHQVFPQLVKQVMRSNPAREAMPNRFLPEMKILEHKRNSKKFKIGQLAGNAFEIVLRDIDYMEFDKQEVTLSEKDQSKDIQAALEKKLSYIKQHGFPNYFGEQRFGRNNQNIELLKKHLNSDLNKRRELRGRIISTLRALVFNRYLSERIEAHTARQYIAGDVLQFSDGNSLFTNRDQDPIEIIQQRLDEGSIVISGPLIGLDKTLATDESLLFEEKIVRKFRTYMPVLERFQVNSARRALFTPAKHLTWYFSGKDLFLNFELASGSFATSLIRELVIFRNQKVVD